MKKLLLPLILLLVGVGGGVGAGLALAPAPPETPPEGGLDGALAAPCGPIPDAAETATAEGAEGHGAEEAGDGEHAAAGGPEGHAYVKIPNQFIVPLMTDGEVTALVLLSLSLEVPAGAENQAAPLEPKLRSAFLQVLFDHANTGGFDGMFTASAAMRGLRAALLDAAREASGGLVTDVLVVEMVREDR